MLSDPAAEPRRLGRHVAHAVELAHRRWQEWIAACEQLSLSTGIATTMLAAAPEAVVTALRPLPISTRISMRGGSVSPPADDDLAAAQAGAVGNAERSLVLETGPAIGRSTPGIVS